MSPLPETTPEQKIKIKDLNERDTLAPERHFNRKNGQTNPESSTQKLVERILRAQLVGRRLGKH